MKPQAVSRDSEVREAPQLTTTRTRLNSSPLEDSAGVKGSIRRGNAQRPRLSPRQQEVLALIIDGRTEIEIADNLGIAPRTVRMHADTLRAKLGVARRRELPRAYRESMEERSARDEQDAVLP
jgi:DNA-binding CsgD family transcriptional regulator